MSAWISDESGWDRRRFIRAGAAAFAGCGIVSGLSARPQFPEAGWYEKKPDLKILCKLCPHQCQVADRERGTCGVRENDGGVYRTHVYGEICAAHVDPIEKKPLFHYFPTAKAYSVAAAGCNFICTFCQNWEISQKRPEQIKSVKLTPRQVVEQAHLHDCTVIAHTYTEPVVFAEFVRDCAREGARTGIPNVMITNGYIEPEPMTELCRHLGAVKVDLKAFTETFYREQCGGALAPVLKTLKLVQKMGVWLEIVVLLIPTLNDSAAEIQRMTRWIMGELGPDVPVHFSRYHPTFMLRNIPPTPPASLFRARTIALEGGLHYVYIGNLMSEAENTRCHGCGALLIERIGYDTDASGIKDGQCRFCGQRIPGVFN